jgi:4-amino-4-deoxy-L-arabinose transferase-like glycosyltransferase
MGVSMGAERNEPVSVRRFFLFLILYLACHLVLRVLVTGNAELDEAEQVVWGQQFALGYGAELPLYTWLQAIFFSLFGTNIFAVSLLRSLLLFVLYLFTYLNALEITESRRCAIAAAASLLLIPLISWEAQRILITMLLATVVTSVTLFLFLRILRTGLLRYYLLLGLAAGLGMLTKYNFGIFIFSLLLSALSIHKFRSRLASGKILATLAVFLLVTAAPFSWILSHSAAAMAKAGKLHPAADVSLFRGYLEGFGDLVKGVAGFHLFLVPVILSIFYKAPMVEDISPQNKELRNLLGRAVLIAIGICAILVLFFHVTHLKSRWLLPLLYPVPIYLISLLQDKLGLRQFRRVLVCSGVTAGFILLALPGRILLARHVGSYSRMNAPYDLLAVDLRKSGFIGGVIAAESDLVGGNLKLRFPESRVVVPGFEKVPASNTVPVLLVWDATGREGVPERLSSLVASLSLEGRVEVRYTEAPALYMPERKVRLGFILVLPRSSSQILSGEKRAAFHQMPQINAARFL